MADGMALLERKIAQLRALPSLAERAAPEVAKALEAELRANIAAGVGPDGGAWPKTKDGRTPLAGASKALTVAAVGDVIVARLDGAEARHHLGKVRGHVRRQILPSRKMPAPLTRAIRTVVVDEFRRTMGGAR